MTPLAWQRIALIGYFGTLILIVAWYGWLSPPRLLSPALVVLVLGTPLLLPLRGLLHGRPYTYAWSLFLALGYFTHGVIELYSTPSDRLFALAELAFTLLWFSAGTQYVRSLKRRTA